MIDWVHCWLKCYVAHDCIWFGGKKDNLEKTQKNHCLWYKAHIIFSSTALQSSGCQHHFPTGITRNPCEKDSWTSSQACWITCPGGLKHHLAVEASGPGYTRMGRGRRIQVARHEPACSSLATTEGPQVLFKQRFLFCKVPWELVSSLQKSALLNKIPSHYPCQKNPKLHVCCRMGKYILIRLHLVLPRIMA